MIGMEKTIKEQATESKFFRETIKLLEATCERIDMQLSREKEEFEKYTEPQFKRKKQELEELNTAETS